MVRRCVDEQSCASVAAKFVNRSLVSLDAVMTEVNIMRNTRHAGLVQPKCVYETDTAYVVVMPLYVFVRCCLTCVFDIEWWYICILV